MPNQTKSQILIATVILLMITLGIGAAVLLFSRSVREGTHQQLDLEKAYSLAKTGLEKTIYCVKKNPSSFMAACIGNYSLGGGYINVTLVNTTYGTSSKVDITSTGGVGKSRSILRDSLIFSFIPQAPPCNPGWIKAYGVNNIEDRLKFIVKTSDGGYLFVGQTDVWDHDTDWDRTLYVLKVDEDGNLSGGKCGTSQKCWAKKYRLAYDWYGLTYHRNFREVGRGIETFDKLNGSSTGYIFGTSITGILSADIEDIVIIKVDTDGNLIWGKGYAVSLASGCGTTQCIEQLEDIKQTFDSGPLYNATGYIVAGYTDTDAFKNSKWDSYHFFAMKTDTEGNCDSSLSPLCASQKCWAKTYSTDSTVLYSVDQLPGGGYIFFGKCQGACPSGTSLILKTDADGIPTLGKWFTAATVEWGSLTGDGGYFVTGGGSGTPNYGYLLKFNATDGLEWGKRYNTGYVTKGVQANDGGYILAGENKTGPYNYQSLWLVKTNNTGGLEWANTYGSNYTEAVFDFFQQKSKSLIKTNDNGYLLGGWANYWDPSYTYNDFFAVKTDSNGTICPSCSYVNNCSVSEVTLSPSINTATPTYFAVPTAPSSKPYLLIRKHTDFNFTFEVSNHATRTTLVCPD